MLNRNYAGQESCSVAQVLEIIGERWTWLIIRDAFLGLTKFIEFERSLGIARNVLTDRLNRLVEDGIFERVLYQERPARYEYRLTQKGSDLFTALNALRQWGDQYLSAKPMRLLRRKHDKTPPSPRTSQHARVAGPTRRSNRVALPLGHLGTALLHRNRGAGVGFGARPITVAPLTASGSQITFERDHQETL